MECRSLRVARFVRVSSAAVVGARGPARGCCEARSPRSFGSLLVGAVTDVHVAAECLDVAEKRWWNARMGVLRYGISSHSWVDE